ncbi:hypothetical protein [Flavobacterium beibuense]|uniref:Uncharacterized protein n=1 Tax=Flavobacterium beibuense TaxID=657326 RepID=A0A444WGC7_9FLAO|nr:hypothetical protein [Flavobacterium beibuense]RYJ44855.1 hypothetical protein NU09_0489 [Flavobacterium beibuense]
MMDITKPRTFVLSIIAILTVLFLVLISLIIIFNFGMSSFGNYGMNKTVGWAWDINNYAPFIALFALILCLLGYITMWILKFKVSKLTSLINLGSLILALAIGSITMIIMSRLPELILSLTAFIMLLVNFSFGIRAKMYDKKQNLQ